MYSKKASNPSIEIPNRAAEECNKGGAVDGGKISSRQIPKISEHLHISLFLNSKDFTERNSKRIQKG